MLHYIFPSLFTHMCSTKKEKQTKPHHICEKVHWVCKISAITPGLSKRERMKEWNVLKAFQMVIFELEVGELREKSYFVFKKKRFFHI